MVHPAAYPSSWLSCLKHHHDPQCFIWSLLAQHHQFCLLGQRHRKRMPRPTAALTFCTLPEHGPDPTVPDESLRSPICATIRALPQSHVRWAPMHSQPWSPSTTSGCLRDCELPTGLVPLPPQPGVFAVRQVLPCPCAPRFPSQGKQGTRWHGANRHIHTGRGVPRSHGCVMHCNVSCNVQAVLAFGTNISSLREGVRTA